MLEDITNIIVLVKVVQALYTVDLAWKYKWVISNSNLNVAKKLKLTIVMDFQYINTTDFVLFQAFNSGKEELFAN